MNGLDKSLTELHGMLKTAERGITSKLEKSKSVLMIKAKGGVTKRKSVASVTGKGKAKAGRSGKPKKNEEKIPPDAVCFECFEKGHWK